MNRAMTRTPLCLALPCAALALLLGLPWGCHAAAAIESRIIKSNSYVVSLHNDGRFRCGGSIIGKEWILTAAHCLYDATSLTMTVRAGSIFYNRSGSSYKAEAVEQHPEYDKQTNRMDVGLVRLAEPLAVSDGVQPLTLVAEGNETASRCPLTVTGWGKTCIRPDCGLSDTLDSVVVPTVDRASCAKAYGGEGILIDETMLCAGARGQDSCQGDSGGPLFACGGLQVGVVSFGKSCGDAGYPGVYANLAYKGIRAWIKKVSGI